MPGARARARCPVCSNPVATGTPGCRACGTPHHGDCWSFNGGCGIYACRGRLRVGSGTQAPDPGELRARFAATVLTLAVLALALGRGVAVRLFALL